MNSTLLVCYNCKKNGSVSTGFMQCHICNKYAFCSPKCFRDKLNEHSQKCGKSDDETKDIVVPSHPLTTEALTFLCKFITNVNAVHWNPDNVPKYSVLIAFVNETIRDQTNEQKIGFVMFNKDTVSEANVCEKHENGEFNVDVVFEGGIEVSIDVDQNTLDELQRAVKRYEERDGMLYAYSDEE